MRSLPFYVFALTLLLCVSRAASLDEPPLETPEYVPYTDLKPAGPEKDPLPPGVDGPPPGMPMDGNHEIPLPPGEEEKKPAPPTGTIPGGRPPEPEGDEAVAFDPRGNRPLTDPADKLAAAEEFVTRFVTGWQAGDPDLAATWFADKVDYLTHGKKPNVFVRDDLARHYERFPVRRYALESVDLVEMAGRKRVHVEATVGYEAEGSGKAVKGRVKLDLRLAPTRRSFEIERIREKTTILSTRALPGSPAAPAGTLPPGLLNDRLIVPGVRAGHFVFGRPIPKAAFDEYGKPDIVSPASPGSRDSGNVTWRHPDLNVKTGDRESPEHVYQLFLRDKAYRTESGIAVGSTEQAVRKAYPDAKREEEMTGEGYCDHSLVAPGISFEIQGGRVVGIGVHPVDDGSGE